MMGQSVMAGAGPTRDGAAGAVVATKLYNWLSLVIKFQETKNSFAGIR